MRKIPLTQGYVALVDDEDYPLVKQLKWRTRVDRRPDGTIKKVYAMRDIPRANGKWSTQSLHRFLVGVTEPQIQVDHIDGNGLNCTRKNMRVATNAENNRNVRRGTTNTSGVKGVYWDKRRSKWKAQIQVNGRRIFLGSFSDILDAGRAYNAAALKYFGAFAHLNVIPDAPAPRAPQRTLTFAAVLQ